MTPVKPLVSVVVVATGDAGGTLRDALASVARQQLDGEIEVIVVDDASRPAVHLTAREITSGVRLVRQPHRMGASAARNRGLGLATGRYVAFLDARDHWTPGMLPAALGAMHDQARPWSVSEISLLAGGGRQRAPVPPGDALADAAVLSPSALVGERTLLWASGGFSASTGPLAGWELSIRLAKVAEPAIVAEPLVVVGSAGQHGRGRLPWTMLAERRALTRKYGGGRQLGGPRFAFAVSAAAPRLLRPMWRRAASRG